MKTRRAVSLIELLVIMSTCTVGLTLTGVLLHCAMRIQMQSRAHADAERNALRLSVQFRRDVHQARAAVTNSADRNSNVLVRLEFADGRNVEYSRVASTLLRLESGGGKQIWREEFVFPAMSESTIEQEIEPQRLILSVSAKPTEQPPAGGKPLVSTYVVPSLRVEAVVGRNLRFSSAPTEQEGRK